MLYVQYADRNSSGLLAQKIGWINFGQNLRLSNGNPSAYVENTIPCGYKISFNLNISVTGNPLITPSVVYEGFAVPTYSAAPFGTVDYTGIKYGVALYTRVNPTIGNIIDIQIVLNNIRVTDEEGNNMQFLLFAADAETTNQGRDSAAEIWSVTTNGGDWQLVQLIPSVSGVTDASPVVTGVGTKTATETGIPAGASLTSANVFSTFSPTQVIARARVDGGREGFSFGVIVFPDDCCKSKSTYIKDAVVLTAGASKCYEPCSEGAFFGSIILNGTEYAITDEVAYIDGSVATYIVTNRRILVEADQDIPPYYYDFLVVMESDGFCMNRNLLVFKGVGDY